MSEDLLPQIYLVNRVNDLCLSYGPTVYDLKLAFYRYLSCFYPFILFLFFPVTAFAVVKLLILFLI